MDKKEFHSELEKNKMASSAFLDKAILTASFGSFALSLTLVRNLDQFIDVDFLIYSWFSFVVCIFFTLASYELVIWDCKIKQSQLKKEEEIKGYEFFINFIRFIYLISFGLGVIFLLYFTIQVI